MNIKERITYYNNILSKKNIKLVAISKTKPIQDIIEAYEAGQRDFGENKIQELTQKVEQLRDYKDINWHYIGHLQRNKVKKILPIVHLIHAIDSKRLLLEVNKQAEKLGICTSILLQVHIAQEKEKFGLLTEEIENLLYDNTLTQLNHICVEGLMGMATHTNDKDVIENEFKTLTNFYHNLQNRNDFAIPKTNISQLSMGMTNDFEIALKHQPTYVRIGSGIFGERTLSQ